MSLIPLESNPDVMNKFLHKLGVPDKWNIVDVYGLDGDALAWVPRPVIALMLLFPCSDKFYKHADEERDILKEKGQEVSSKLFYMKQYIPNACGTIALLHCVANNADRVELKSGPFKKILDDSAGLSPEEKGEMLLKAATNSDSEVFQIICAHKELSLEGQTEANPNEQVNHHFIAFVEKDGSLYELDGRKEFPINHGKTTPDSFLEDAAKVCKQFIARDADDVSFTLMALTATDD